MVRAVNNTKADCGIIVRSGLKENIINKNYKHLFVLYKSSSSVYASLTKEILYTQFTWCFSPDLGAEIIGNGISEERTDLEDCRIWISKAIEEYQAEGGNFHFQYETVEGKVLQKEEKKLTQAFPVRGLISIFIMIIGLFRCREALPRKTPRFCAICALGLLIL